MITKITTTVSTILSLPIHIISFVYSFVSKMKQNLIDLMHHLSILKDANISLGKFHLQKGNFTDAALRFRIIDKFFAAKDPENLFWLGFTLMMQKKYAKAISALENNTYDKIGLGNYITNMSSLGKIPKEIYKEYDAVFTQIKYKRYYIDKINLFERFTSVLLPLIPTNSWDNHNKYSVLEIYSHPFWIEEFSKFLPENSMVDTLNFDAEISGIAKTYNAKSNIYSNISLAEDMNSAQMSTKYDCIIAFDSLSNNTDLASAFKSIKSILNDDSIFAFVLPRGSKVKIQPNMNHFVFSKDYIVENLKLANLYISSIIPITITPNLEYFIIVAK